MKQLSTMDKPGTMLVSACQTPLSVIHLEHTVTPAVDVEMDNAESEPEEAEGVELYEEESAEVNPDEPDPVSDSDDVQETAALSLLTHSIWSSYSTCFSLTYKVDQTKNDVRTIQISDRSEISIYIDFTGKQ